MSNINNRITGTFNQVAIFDDATGLVTSIDTSDLSNVNLGNVANIHITGGNSCQVLSTDGSGNLTFSNATATPGGVDGQIQFNNKGSLGGASGLSYSAGTTQANAITVTGSITSVGVTNLGAVANVHITGGSNAQVLTTDGAGNLSWTTVSGGGGGGSIIFSDATWSGANAYSWNGNASVVNPKSITANYITADNANSVTLLTLNGTSVSNLANITVSNTSLSIPAGEIPNAIQTTTTAITMVVRLSNGTTQELGSTTLTPILNNQQPFAVSGSVSASVSNPAAVPFWGTYGTGNVSASGPTVTGGTFANVTYTLFDGTGGTVATFGPNTTPQTHTFTSVAVGAGYTVAANVFGSGLYGANPNAASNTTSSAVTITQSTYTPVFLPTITTDGNVPTVPTVTISTPAQSTGFTSGDQVSVGSSNVANTQWFWLATPGTSSRTFQTTVSGFTVTITPGSSGNTQTVTGNSVSQQYSVYGFQGPISANTLITII